MSNSQAMVGVIGAGSFGAAMANIIVENKPVLLYTKREESAERLRTTRQYTHGLLHPNIEITTDLAEIAERCRVIFPIVPSAHFRGMIRELGHHLLPSHILIHGTKGLDLSLPEGSTGIPGKLDLSRIKTISEVILEETHVLRVGCIGGPNLAGEIAANQPAATVVASRFEEVCREGIETLRSRRFRVHTSNDIVGVELAGVLKNIMAIAAGALRGLGFGNNTHALLVARGLAEMIHIGKFMGADPRAFLGIAGVGDLVATCGSEKSRNFTVGYRLAQGETLPEIMATMSEVAEGIKTIQIIEAMASHHRFSVPITHVLHRILFEGMEVERGMNLMMEYPFTNDVEFL